jgi:Fe-S-cluster containining protein
LQHLPLLERKHLVLSPVLGEPDPTGADCVGCGRCCHHGPETVHFFEADEARMGVALLAEYTHVLERPPGFRFMNNDGACAGLDRSAAGHYPCKVYGVRPEGCRVVEAGSPACMEARAKGHLGTSVLFRRRDRIAEGGAS